MGSGVNSQLELAISVEQAPYQERCYDSHVRQIGNLLAQGGLAAAGQLKKELEMVIELHQQFKLAAQPFLKPANGADDSFKAALSS